MSAEADTLGGYEAVHGRPPAFEGPDGCAYTAGVFSEESPGPDGRYGAALIFVRWTPAQEPEGHVETEFLAFDADPSCAEDAVCRLSLYDVKHHLDRMISAAARPEAL